MLRLVTLLYTDPLNLATLRLASLLFAPLRSTLRLALHTLQFTHNAESSLCYDAPLDIYTQFRVLLPYHALLLPLRPNHSASPLPGSTSPLLLTLYTALSYLFATIVLLRCSSSLYTHRQVVSPLACFVLCFALHRTPSRCFTTIFYISFRSNS